MQYLANSVSIILFLAFLTGILLYFLDKPIEKYQNKFWLIIYKLNQICSTIILIPLQIMLSLIIISFVLYILVLIFQKAQALNELTILLIFSLWLITMQFYMKYLWKYIECFINTINKYLNYPRIVSSFIGHIFYGNVLIYIVAMIFVVLNNINISTKLLKNEIFVEFMNIIYPSILIFIAADRVISSIQNWFKDKKNNTI
jgi:hypothetical protein